MNSKFYKGLAAVAIAAGFASCSDDYLQTEPITSISGATAVATTEAAQMTVYGISRIMNTQNDQGRSHTQARTLACNGSAKDWVRIMYPS